MRRAFLAGAALAALVAAPGAGSADTMTPVRLSITTLADLTPCNGETAAMRFDAPYPERLAGDPGARRRGPVLQVGRARFRDRPFHAEDINGASYGYIGRYAGAPIVLVAAAEGEGWGYNLVDPATGRFVDIAGMPVLGPDGRTFVGVTREEDYHAAGVEIVEWRDGRLTRQTLWMRACQVAWAGPERLTYRVGFDGAGGEGRIEREGGRWVATDSTGHRTEPQD